MLSARLLGFSSLLSATLVGSDFLTAVMGLDEFELELVTLDTDFSVELLAADGFSD